MRNAAEYICYRLLAFVVPLLPRRPMVWLGRRLGGLYFLVSARARAVGRENLARVFPERTDRARILRESMRLQGVALLDALWSKRLRPQTVGRYLDMYAVSKRVHELGGTALAVAHYGSWEMLAAGAGVIGFPRTTFIARPLRNAWIDRHVRRVRERSGNVLVYREGALRACRAALKRGDPICSVIDMAVLPVEGGRYVDFFGTPALTSTAVPMMAVRFKAPLVFMVARPVEKGYRYIVEWEQIEVRETEDRQAEVDRLAVALNGALERLIRKQPEPWIWTYKRWKGRPSELVGNYPSYALWIVP